VLDFAQFLVQKTEQEKQLSSESSESNISSTTEPSLKLSLREIASLPIAERHKILAPFIPATAEDFLTYPELTEFSALDGEDWEDDRIQKVSKLYSSSKTSDQASEVN